MSIFAHFVDEVTFSPHCGSKNIAPQTTLIHKASSWAVNKAIYQAIDKICQNHSGLSLSDFVKITNPEDFTLEFKFS